MSKCILVFKNFVDKIVFKGHTTNIELLRKPRRVIWKSILDSIYLQIITFPNDIYNN